MFVRAANLAICGLWALTPHVAWAGDPVAADALFTEALALLDAGNWDGACPKFRASFDLDRSVSTMINLARCSEHSGKVATALGQLGEASRLNLDTPEGARKGQLDAYIKKLSDEMSPRVPRVRLVVRGAPKEALTITRDGSALPSSSLGESLPHDPGEHTLVVSAVGFRTVERSYSVRGAEASEVIVELVAEAPAAPSLKPERPVGSEQKPKPPRLESASESGPSGQTVAAVVLLGLGGASLAAGGVFAGLTGAKAGEIPDGCGQDPYVCTNDADTLTANDASDSGSTFLTVSVITGAAGAALVATGAILFATAGAPPSAAFVLPIVGPSVAGAEVHFVW